MQFLSMKCISDRIFSYICKEWIHFNNQKISTMNTKKLFFGLMAVAFMAMTVVSTTAVSDDSVKDTTSIKKKGMKKF